MVPDLGESRPGKVSGGNVRRRLALSTELDGLCTSVLGEKSKSVLLA